MVMESKRPTQSSCLNLCEESILCFTLPYWSLGFKVAITMILCLPQSLRMENLLTRSSHIIMSHKGSKYELLVCYIWTKVMLQTEGLSK